MKNQRKINLIVVHCSATRVNQDFPVEALEACHKARGFHSIGYHYYITKDGMVYPCRPENEVGAHARHYNAHTASESATRVVSTRKASLPTLALQPRRILWKTSSTVSPSTIPMPRS